MFSLAARLLGPNDTTGDEFFFKLWVDRKELLYILLRVPSVSDDLNFRANLLAFESRCHDKHVGAVFVLFFQSFN